MRVRLLGPVDVAVGDASRPVPGLRRKAVLAVLALHPGQVVSVDRLVDTVWGDAAPPTAVNTLQSHVSHLRQVLGGKASILTRRPGYLLALPDDDGEASDVQVAERLIRQGGRCADARHRARLMRAALDLWRGRPLADVTGVAWLAEQAERLERLRLRAGVELIETRLALGEHAQVVPDLEQLAREHPFDERIHGLLMLAQYRGGRQADALAAYRRLRAALGRDLGIDPGRGLRDLEAAILRQDAALDPAPPAIAVRPPAATAPGAAQLPLAVRGFAGRAAQLSTLDGLLPDATAPGAAAVVICAVSGTAGVGKTTLAVHWAHRAAGAFPDGQLYANLRGYDPSGPAMEPAEALRGFLAALGVPALRIPDGLPARTALYRSVLAGLRVLVVLDNARDVEQVRPLLPGTPGCLVVVTSRDQLTPLVVAEGARPLTLDRLSTPEGHDLLAHRLGAARLAAEPDAVEEIIARCARLPLALAIASARAATNPRLALASLAGELRDAASALGGPLGGGDGDAATNLWTVFSWSYHTLGPPAARLFRLLGLHSGPDIGVAAAASLCGEPPVRARALLAELARAHLVVEDPCGRYSSHDLLRAYAAELAADIDGPDERGAALRRVLDHYVHSAHAGAHLLQPHRDPIELAPAAPGVARTVLGDADRAMAWFTAEHPVLLAAVHRSVAARLDTHAWQLVWALADFLDRRGHWRDWGDILRVALHATRRLADRSGEAYVRRGLGRACAQLDLFDEASGHFRAALGLFGAVGDDAGQAHSHLNLAWLFGRQGRSREAVHHAREALTLYRAAGHHAGQARALNSLGWQHAQLTEYDQALTYCRESLALIRRLGDRRGEANTWDSMGYAHANLGDHPRATACYQRAVRLFRQTGDRYYEADTLAHLGDAHAIAGFRSAAHRAWRGALAILEELGHPDAGQVRARLDRSDTPVAARR